MSISGTYKRLLIDDYIKSRLLDGQVPSASDILAEAEELAETKDLSLPQFTASGHYTAEQEQSSTSKFKATANTIRQDMRVLYKEMINLTSNSTDAFERWRLESDLLEKSLVDLEDRIENLLLLTQDTEGFHSVLIDNFTDNSQVDTDLTTAEVDYLDNRVVLGASNDNSQRVFLNDLTQARVVFRIRNRQGYIGFSDGANTNLISPFLQDSSSWWRTIHMATDKVRPVTCELTVQIADDPTEISKIRIVLHDSSQSGPTYITPLYSVDNVNYSQLPTQSFSKEVRGSAVFSFAEVSARYVKFVMTKVGPDPGAQEDSLDFQFGFKEISFFSEGFTANDTQQLFTNALWVAQEDGTPLEFEKLTLETCETLEDGTTIDYFIATSNTASFTVDSDTIWIPVSPIQRNTLEYPVILDVSDTTEVVLGDTESVTISYSGLAGLTDKNPAPFFHLVSRESAQGDLQDEVVSGIVPRYRFVNSNERILNYQVKDADYSGSGGFKIDTNEDTMVVFRNVGQTGLTPGDTAQMIRGVQRGWKFEDPYYETVIEILNPEGLQIDVGDQPIIVDDETPKTNLVTIAGKTPTFDGIHRVRVHKDNWREVTPGATSLSDLKSKDVLYTDQGAYNHKLLIEGYQYDSSWPTTETKPYTGADLFASEKMKRVSIFDMNNNIAASKYDVYALDRDAPNSHTVSGIGQNNPTRVFVVKVDEGNPDFQNEKFVIRFKLLNELRKYLRIRADLSTTNGKITPSLESYKVKLG
jgi:hypothetical protein